MVSLPHPLQAAELQCPKLHRRSETVDVTVSFLRDRGIIQSESPHMQLQQVNVPMQARLVNPWLLVGTEAPVLLATGIDFVWILQAKPNIDGHSERPIYTISKHTKR